MITGPRKYIIIPEFRPLYGMAECFGPLHGPLTQPTITPLPVIRKLLLQSGNDKLTIFEVKKLSNGTFTPPVRLTMENYTLPYDEIANNITVPATTTDPVTVQENTVSPTVTVAPPNKAEKPSDNNQEEPKERKELVLDLNDVVTTNTDATAVKASEGVIVANDIKVDLNDAADVTPVEDEDVADDGGSDEDVDIEIEAPRPNPYAGMTKAQRRAAQKEAARQAVKNREMSGEK